MFFFSSTVGARHDRRFCPRVESCLMRAPNGVKIITRCSLLPGLERKAIELVAPHFRQADVGLRNGFDRYLERGGIVSKRCSDVIYLDIHRTRLRGIYGSPSQKINNVGCLAGIQVETIGYYQLVFFQLVSSHPAFYLCLFGVSTRNIHRERFCLLVLYQCSSK